MIDFEKTHEKHIINGVEIYTNYETSSILAIYNNVNFNNYFAVSLKETNYDIKYLVSILTKMEINQNIRFSRNHFWILGSVQYEKLKDYFDVQYFGNNSYKITQIQEGIIKFKRQKKLEKILK